MKYRYTTVILWITLAGATLNIDIPEIIYDYCPYSDICNRTASRDFNAVGLVPCCSSCKCDENCGLRLDCCFDDLDKYRLKENGIVECIYPSNGKSRENTFSYWMIKTCKNKTAEGFQNDRNISCELYDGKGHSIVEPVSSVETGYIYVNAKCAKCNEVYNFKKWDFLFLAYYQQRDSLTVAIETNLENRIGELVYIPPRNENWSSKRCSVKGKVTCDTRSTFYRLCQTMHAPVLANGGIFLNPACLLCFNNRKPATECNDALQRTPPRRFTVLIDNSVVESSNVRKNEMINKSLKAECLNKMTVLLGLDPCLEIHCPSGMLRTLHTGCTYFISRWYISSFMIIFKLLAKIGNELPAEDLNALNEDERKNPLLWMKCPCQNVNATVIEVFYEKVKDDQEIVQSFKVQFSKVTPTGINPSVTIPALQRCLKYDWHIKILGKTYSFYPTLMKQLEVTENGKRFLENKLTMEKEEIRRPDLYEHIATGSKSNINVANNFLKTFFCDQVNVPMHDVEVTFGEIRIISKNVTLKNNEYTINYFRKQLVGSAYMNDLSKTTFSVCIEDYDSSYYQRHSNNALFPRVLVLEQFVIYHFIITLLCGMYDVNFLY